MKDFADFLQFYDKMLQSGDIKEEKQRLYDQVIASFFEYPQCEKMLIDAVKRTERTGELFYFYYNYVESPNPPKDFYPIGVRFPSDNYISQSGLD